MALAFIEGVLLFILISTLSKVNKKSSRWEPGERGVPLWAAIAIALGVQIAQGLVWHFLPSVTGFWIGVLGSIPLIAFLLIKLCGVDNKSAFKISALYPIVALPVQFGFEYLLTAH
jgi:hypothetical protein